MRSPVALPSVTGPDVGGVCVCEGGGALSHLVVRSEA